MFAVFPTDLLCFVSCFQSPGVKAYMYMPPEALDESPMYTTCIDIFSFGQLALYTIIQQFPFANSATCIDPSKPGTVVARSEIERRSRYLEKMAVVLSGSHHAVMQLVIHCLQNDPRQRPSARQVLQRLKEGWVTMEADNPYERMTKLELIVATKLLKVTKS